MNSFGKTVLICLVVFMCAAGPLFAQNLDDLQKNANEFSEKMAQALPFYSTMGLNWSDAYIGQITAVPPNFGIGVSAGFTTMDFTSIRALMRTFGLSLPFGDDISVLENIGFPLPGYTAEARIGGIGLPFDFGLKFSYLPQNALNFLYSGDNFGFNNMLIGADIRYALANSKVLPLRLSIGAGFNYLQGGISATFPMRSFSFDHESIAYSLSPTSPELGIDWRTTTVELKTQISFPYKIITPYLGFGVSYAWSQAGYKVTSPELSITRADGSAISDTERRLIEEILLNRYNLTGISGSGFETINKYTGLNTRAFGGIAFNLAYLRFDLTGMYEILGRNLGATFGMRFQL